jgi:hypothetical protein
MMIRCSCRGIRLWAYAYSSTSSWSWNLLPDRSVRCCSILPGHRIRVKT